MQSACPPFFFNDTAPTEIYTLSLHDRSSDLVPEHVSAGRTIPAKLYVRNVKFWMPSFSIHVVGVEQDAPPVLQSPVYFPVIPGGATLEETVQIRFARRGEYRQNHFAFHTRFPFG